MKTRIENADEEDRVMVGDALEAACKSNRRITGVAIVVIVDGTKMLSGIGGTPGQGSAYDYAKSMAALTSMAPVAMGECCMQAVSEAKREHKERGQA